MELQTDEAHGGPFRPTVATIAMRWPAQYPAAGRMT